MYNFSEEDLDLDVFKKEKVAVIVELKKILSNTDKKVSYKDIPEMMFGKRSNLVNDLVDEIKTVRDFKPQDLFRFIEKHYIPEKTVITIAGKFNQAKLLKYIESHVPPRITPHRIPKRIIPIKKTTKPQYIYIKDTGKILYNVTLYLFCPTIDDPKSVGKINILKKILTGISDLSLLKHRLRTKLGSIYSVSTSTETNPYYGVFSISYSIELQNFFKTLGEIITVLNELKEGLFNPKLIKIAKQRYLLNIKNILNSSNPQDYYHYSNKVLNKEELYNTQEYYDKYIKDVDKPQLVKLCKKIFNKDNIYMCAIGPKPLKQDVVMGVLSKLQ
jgi:zinc protease